MGGARWIDKFATGRPIDGILSQKGVFALTKPGETESGHALLFQTAEARFRERSDKSGKQMMT